MSRIDRIVAGVSGRPGNLPALRYAADLARACDAGLMFVHAVHMAWMSQPCRWSCMNAASTPYSLVRMVRA